MTTITCKIPEELDARLAASARRRRVSKSTIVREAIEQRIKSEGRRAAPRAFDLVKHLAGTLRGPKDLASNPKYLEDFGV